jgi:uncharacterized protein (TIGR02147 family)
MLSVDEWLPARHIVSRSGECELNDSLIFNFEIFSEYFRAYMQERKRIQPAFSMRFLCRKTGIKSPAVFAWIASGKRLPSKANLEALRQVCDWRTEEFEYAQLMILLARARSKVERLALKQAMASLIPRPHVVHLTQDASSSACRLCHKLQSEHGT